MKKQFFIVMSILGLAGTSFFDVTADYWSQSPYCGSYSTVIGKTYSSLSGEFEAITFKLCVFKGAKVSPTMLGGVLCLVDCNLDGADLSGMSSATGTFMANIFASEQGAVSSAQGATFGSDTPGKVTWYAPGFRGTNLTGATFKNVTYTSYKNTYDFAAHFYGTILDKTDFTNAKMEVASFTGAKGSGTIFKNTTLEKARFNKVNFTNPNFSNADLLGANFSGATLNSPDFTNTNLSGANFSGATISSPNFIKTTLAGAKFINARLSNNINFDNIDLTNVDFSGASFGVEALPDFSGANLTGANFSGVKGLSAKDLAGALNIDKALNVPAPEQPAF